MPRSIAFIRHFEFGNPLAALQDWWRHQCYRNELRHLLAMRCHYLDDIGLTREEAEREAGVPFWKGRHVPPLRPL